MCTSDHDARRQTLFAIMFCNTTVSQVINHQSTLTEVCCTSAKQWRPQHASFLLSIENANNVHLRWLALNEILPTRRGDGNCRKFRRVRVLERETLYEASIERIRGSINTVCSSFPSMASATILTSLFVARMLRLSTIGEDGMEVKCGICCGSKPHHCVESLMYAGLCGWRL